jgi:hypothetical protein
MTTFVTILAFALSMLVADLSGVWTLNWQPDFGGNDDAYDCTLKQSGQNLALTCRDNPPIIGSVDGEKIILRFKTGRDGSETATLTGEVDQRGITITGTWHLTEQNRSGRFVATKQ